MRAIAVTMSPIRFSGALEGNGGVSPKRGFEARVPSRYGHDIDVHAKQGRQKPGHAAEQHYIRWRTAHKTHCNVDVRTAVSLIARDRPKQGRAGHAIAGPKDGFRTTQNVKGGLPFHETIITQIWTNNRSGPFAVATRQNTETRSRAMRSLSPSARSSPCCEVRSILRPKMRSRRTSVRAILNRVIGRSGGPPTMRSISLCDPPSSRATDPNRETCATPAARSSSACDSNKAMTSVLRTPFS